MRNLSNKANTVDTLSDAEWNQAYNELKNLVTASGQTLDDAAGPDNDLFMAARSILIHALAGPSYSDGGVANSFVLTATRAGFRQPTAYEDGMAVRFQAANTNTGACTINVAGLGSISLTVAGGGALASSAITAGNFVIAEYNSANNRFEVVSNSTPPAVGPASPNNFAVYADAGSASLISLTIVTGFTQPSALTDQVTILFRANATNDGDGTHQVAISGLTTKNIVEADGTNPAAGRITAGSWVFAIFREARDAWEIAYVSEIPQPGTVLNVDIDSSSGTLFNVSSRDTQRAPLAYFDGLTLIFRAPQTITGSVDINLNGLGAKDLRNLSGSNFASGGIKVNDLVIAVFEEANDRFRCGIIEAAPVDPASIDRVARLDNPSTTNVTTTTPISLTWPSAPASDPLGFYSAPNDTFVIPSGVVAIDAIFNLQGSFQGGSDDDAAILCEILSGGVRVGSASVRFSQGGEHVCVAVMGIEVTAGQQVNARITKSGSGTYSIVSTTNFTIRASRVS